MNCRKVYRNLSAYHDRLLSPEKTFQLEQHLRDCPECMQRWREFSEIVKATGYLKVQNPLPDFNQRLLEKVTSLRQSPHQAYESVESKRWPAYAVAFAGVAVAFAVLLTFPQLKKAEGESLSQAPQAATSLQEEFELGEGTFSYQVSETKDSLWWLLEDIDELPVFGPDGVREETRIYRRYILPVVDVDRQELYPGKSYLVAPISSEGAQSTDVVF